MKKFLKYFFMPFILSCIANKVKFDWSDLDGELFRNLTSIPCVCSLISGRLYAKRDQPYKTMVLRHPITTKYNADDQHRLLYFAAPVHPEYHRQIKPDLQCRTPVSCQSDTNSENTQQWTDERVQMVDHQIIRRGITNQSVVTAMRIVPRHKFVPLEFRDFSYNDRPLPIGFNQTISQPYIVAAMTDALDLSPEDKVLEIGTGSGYQAAILAQLVSNIYSIEIVPELAERAEQTITELGYTNIHFKCGDGYQGWPDESPFDAIIVTCAPDEIPKPLIDQLADNGRIIIPVGGRYSQELVRVTKKGKELIREKLMYVIFVPMTGKAME